MGQRAGWEPAPAWPMIESRAVRPPLLPQPSIQPTVPKPVHTEEHERFSARLASIPGVELIPSFGAWIVLKVEDPTAFARWMEERIPGAGLTVPSHLQGAVRIPVRDAKKNDFVQQAVREHFAALAAVDRHLDPA